MPNKTSKTRTYQRTLAFVNKARRSLGRKPLKRLPHGGIDPTSCPIARALDPRSTGNIEVVGREIEDFDPMIANKLRQCKLFQNLDDTLFKGPSYLNEFVTLHDEKNAYGLQTDS